MVAVAAKALNLLSYKGKPLILFMMIMAGLLPAIMYSHPLPDTKMAFHIAGGNIQLTIDAPLRDFELACGNPEGKPLSYIENYFNAHLHITPVNGKTWPLHLERYSISTEKYEAIGQYRQIRFVFSITPGNAEDTRNFTITSDAFVHSIYTHKAIVSIDTDWQNGLYGQDIIVGIIGHDPDGVVQPLHISLEQGSLWKGFSSVVKMGAVHIVEGTDHILFLLALLIIAPFASEGKKWSDYISRRYAFIRIIKIATAFTIGHSLTLLFTSLGWIHISPAVIEVCIALTIMLAGVNVIKPVFAAKETYITLLFGLIHGMAFAETITGLNLNHKILLLSTLGFNLGIELVQLAIIIVILPILLLAAKFRYYNTIQPYVGVTIIGLSCYWFIERLSIFF